MINFPPLVYQVVVNGTFIVSFDMFVTLTDQVLAQESTFRTETRLDSSWSCLAELTKSLVRVA